MRFYHVPDRWKAEVQGGYIREIKVMNKRIAIGIVSLCTEGTHLTISSIPWEGEKQKILFEKDLYIMEDKFCVTRIPMSL